MSVHYLLDGYNIINQMPELVLKKLEDKRNVLLKLVETTQPQGSLNNAVTIVFDGKSGIFWGSGASSRVKVIYTTDETADDKIKRIVEQSKNQKQFIVVTDDRELKYAVRSLGAAVMGVADFKARLMPRKEPLARSRDLGVRETSKFISQVLENKINSELQDLWLKKKKK